jgi:hypothetical protein
MNRKHNWRVIISHECANTLFKGWSIGLAYKPLAFMKFGDLICSPEISLDKNPQNQTIVHRSIRI